MLVPIDSNSGRYRSVPSGGKSGYGVAMPTRARERLVAAAERLFYAEGIRAVGVERLLAVSGVGRASFYRHFPSKDDLVLTMLRGYDKRFREWLASAMADAGDDPAALFDALAARIDRAAFRGCASIRTMIEFVDPDDPLHRAAVAHKDAVIADLDAWLAAAGRADDAELAAQFMLLIDGAIVSTLREPGPAAALRAKRIASALLAAQA
jgi:AcrR family transcriptional regulator